MILSYTHLKLAVAAAVLAVASCVSQPAPASQSALEWRPAAVTQVTTAATPANTPSISQSIAEVCDASTEYALELHKLIQQGADPYQIAKIHVNVLKENSEGIHPAVIQMTNEMVVTIVQQKDTSAEVLQQELVLQCTASLTKSFRKPYI